MVDRVELAAVDHVLDVRHLDHRDAVVGEHDRGCPRRSRSGRRRGRARCCAWMTSARCPSAASRARQRRRRRTRAIVGMPRSSATCAMFRAGSMPSTGTPRVAVVLRAGSRRCSRPRRRGCPAPRPRSADEPRRRASRACCEHRVGERREVEVVAEQLLRRHRLGDLHERAGRAEARGRAGSVGSGSSSWSGASSAFASGVSPSESTGSRSARAARPARDGRRVMHAGSEKLAVPRDRPRAGPRRAMKSGVQPSTLRAFAALRYWCADLVASPRCGRRARASQPISSRIRSTSSSTVTCVSFEKLNASPASVRVRRPAARPAACRRRRRPRRRSSRGRTCRRSG